MGKRKKKPSKTRRHRESVTAKRKARAFYSLRNGGTDVSVPNKTASSGWRRRAALFAARMVATTAVMAMFAVSLGILLWAVAKMVS